MKYMISFFLVILFSGCGENKSSDAFPGLFGTHLPSEYMVLVSANRTKLTDQMTVLHNYTTLPIWARIAAVLRNDTNEQINIVTAFATSSDEYIDHIVMQSAFPKKVVPGGSVYIDMEVFLKDSAPLATRSIAMYGYTLSLVDSEAKPYQYDLEFQAPTSD